uniref:Retrovirus-related Pol polyprotein from transposon TNT 1-94-like beta-barrel domain-containing protein n=1 Tax=Fagus sylvatica TaxID=28930 RepID=A0A2N9EFV4_FAGSY
MRLDLALEVNKSDAITSQSSVGAKAYFNKWVKSNKLCMMIMRLSMDKTIKNSIPQCDNANDYLAAVSKKFVVFDKAEKSNYMRLLTTTTYDGTTGVREHVMRMTNLAMRLRDMKVDIPNSYLVWLILESLPDQFSALKTSYNVVKGEWGLNEMTAIVVQQEEMMRKSTPLALVYFESNLVDVPLNSWWIDTGASIHVTNSLQGFKSKRRPNDGEVAVYMDNGEKALVEFIGVVNLPLASGGALVLDDVVYVPSLRRSLISVSKLDSSGFVFHFAMIWILLHETKRFWFNNFEMKDLGEASFALGIEIHHDKSRGILRLSQKHYVNRILERFYISMCSAGDASIVKGDKLSM